MSETSAPSVPRDDETAVIPVGSHDELALTDEQRAAEIQELNDMLARSDRSEEPNPGSEQLRITVGSIEDVRARARDAADARLSQETQHGGGFRGFIRRIWKGSVAQPYYQQKYQRQAEQEIIETGNLHVHTGGSQEDSDRTIAAAVTQMTHKHADELISAGAGESLQRIDDETDEQAVNVKNGINGLIEAYCSGDLDDANFEEEKNRVLTELAKENPELLGEGLMFADNLLEIAQNVRGMVRHDRGVQAILESVRIDVGKLNTGVRTEANFTRTDEIIDKIQKSKVGALVSETTIETAASVIAAAGRWTIQRGVARAAALTGVGAVGTGLIAGLRESKRIKEERRQHARESAMGMEFDESAKRRQEIEQTRYETLGAQDLTSALDALFDEPDAEGIRQIKDLTEQGFFEAAAIVAQARTRMRLSDERNIDLLHYSSAESVADERIQLLLSTIYAEKALSQLLEQKGGMDWLQNAGLNVRLDGRQETLADLIEQHSAVIEAEISGDMTAKDAVFRKVQRSHVLKAAVIGGTVGLVVGTATQEAIAHLPGIGDSIHGLGEGRPGGGERSTLLNGAWQNISETFGNQDPSNAMTGNLLDVGGGGRFTETEGFTPKQDSAGNWFIEQDGSGKKIDLAYGTDGKLTDESRQALTEAGFDIHGKMTTPELSGVTHEMMLGYNKVVLPEEYNLQQVAPGDWNIVDVKGDVVQNLKLNFDGSLSAETVANLEAGGIGVNHTQDLITETRVVDGIGHHEVIQNHLPDMQQVHRVLWYGNDTPAPNFDLNELKLWAGGVNGSWFDEQGNVVLDGSQMRENWSFQGGQSVNPFEATAEGRLTAAISLSRDTQNMVFNFQFETLPNGKTVAVIPPDHPVHQLFKMDGDKRVFTGAFIETMEHTGQQSPNGENVKILNTFVGNNNPGPMTDVITETHAVHTTGLDIQPAPENIEVITYQGSDLVEAPPIIPLRSRAGLENSNERDEQLPAMVATQPSSNEIEVWRGGHPAVIEQYVKRKVERVVPRSQEVELYNADRKGATRTKFKSDTSFSAEQQENIGQTPGGRAGSQQNDSQKEIFEEAEAQLPVTFSLNGNGEEYSREEMSKIVQEYLANNIAKGSRLDYLLRSSAITTPEEFVLAVEEELDRINNRWFRDSGLSKQSTLRKAALQFMPDHHILSFGRILYFYQADSLQPGSRPGLGLNGQTGRDLLKLMFINARRNKA
jgi:hypothetical protein